ncbi:lipoprotein N-acyltransferase Lnb domain-containing protein [Marinicella gelatinilytica]|uniref:lipoprotein N-acyltransferase Lnb domain-containing protein n=1 Tax=Marinicella gelatinilytica TaxID=2996017 RepID=UPI002260FD62|nr:DUF4105 domain-containing protein [Marinicella gelatinilytica]MCX7544837.1 DUF4105 domain-containing protein [Marinicella gelatinilytica]
MFLFFSAQVHSQTVRLITVGPGDAFWSVYGHTALAIDNQVYAFGYFDFAEDNLVKAFILNDMRYAMGVSNLSDELYQAEYEHRQFSEQILDISPLATSQLKQQLKQHYLPENRHYQYDYFYNNCATKIRDLINQVTDGKLYQRSQTLSPYSYADLTLPAYHQSTMRFGLALGYGYQAYQNISYWQTMAFPMAMDQFISQQMADLVTNESIIYQPPEESWRIIRDHAFFLMLLTGLLIGFCIKPLRGKVIIVWFYLASLIGVVILLLWWVLPHPIADGNFNVLLTNPLLFLAVKRRPAKLTVPILMVSHILWLGFACYWQAWYLVPLAAVHMLFLWILQQKSVQAKSQNFAEN